MGTRVYIGPLSDGLVVKDLERFLKGYGKIREILINNGFALVEFDDYRDADDAVFELHGKDLMGERVTVKIDQGIRSRRTGGRFMDQRRGSWMDKYGPPTRTDYRLIVENLSSKVSWQDLKDFMRHAGDVTYADAHKQRRNEGVVEFATYADMRNAYHKLDNAELSGQKIRLIEDRPRHRRSRSRSSSRSYSRSHSSRSRSRSHSPRHSASYGSRKSRRRSASKSRSGSYSHSRSPVKYRSPPRKIKENSRSKNQEKSASRSMSPLSASRSPKNPEMKSEEKD